MWLTYWVQGALNIEFFEVLPKPKYKITSHKTMKVVFKWLFRLNKKVTKYMLTEKNLYTTFPCEAIKYASSSITNDVQRLDTWQYTPIVQENSSP